MALPLIAWPIIAGGGALLLKSSKDGVWQARWQALIAHLRTVARTPTQKDYVDILVKAQQAQLDVTTLAKQLGLPEYMSFQHKTADATFSKYSPYWTIGVALYQKWGGKATMPDALTLDKEVEATVSAGSPLARIQSIVKFGALGLLFYYGGKWLTSYSDNTYQAPPRYSQRRSRRGRRRR